MIERFIFLEIALCIHGTYKTQHSIFKFEIVYASRLPTSPTICSKFELRATAGQRAREVVTQPRKEDREPERQTDSQTERQSDRETVACVLRGVCVCVRGVRSVRSCVVCVVCVVCDRQRDRGNKGTEVPPPDV